MQVQVGELAPLALEQLGLLQQRSSTAPSAMSKKIRVGLD